MSDERPRVLLAEDDPTARGALRELLELEGYVVRAAVDGADALDQLEAFRPNVLVTDIRMPRLDGVALYHRARERLPGLETVFMTGLSEGALVPDGLRRAPDVQIVRKPVDPDALLELIARVIAPQAS